MYIDKRRLEFRGILGVKSRERDREVGKNAFSNDSRKERMRFIATSSGMALKTKLFYTRAHICHLDTYIDDAYITAVIAVPTGDAHVTARHHGFFLLGRFTTHLRWRNGDRRLQKNRFSKLFSLFACKKI